MTTLKRTQLFKERNERIEKEKKKGIRKTKQTKRNESRKELESNLYSAASLLILAALCLGH